jgi:ribosomal protein S18 acetylase RimI-like enzyme
MISIDAFSSSEVESLADLSRKTFLESHGHSANAEDIKHYVDTHFNIDKLSQALQDPNIYFSKIFVQDQLAGYSKLIINFPNPLIHLRPIAKFERLYLLRDFYGMQLGNHLLAHNADIAISKLQQALWLFVWTENIKALKFYQKSGFKIVGEHDFKISDNHSNPNFVMLKMF